MRRVVWLLSVFVTVVIVAWMGVSTSSFAQDEDEESESPAEDSADVGDAADAEATAPEAADAKPDAAAAASGVTPTWWVGPYIEGVIVPSFMLKLFLAASPSVFNASFGATITHRNPTDGFSWVLGIGYAGYGFDGPFRANGDPELDTEYLDSSLGFVHARGMLLWSSEISRTLSFEYGVGIELGVVVGELKRTEAYKDLSGEYQPCVGAGIPDPSYCEPTTTGLATNAYNEEGAHYHVVEKRVPPVAAALMIPALALRYQPMDKLAIKLEAAFGLLQFTFGLSASYGIGS
ncbi:MAG TPA: hypothetical protein VFG30_33065 [Polyangiales bacterium]|nr:hypothetical protein [Polyangiales bacterium]